jgi:hypothetical protein
MSYRFPKVETPTLEDLNLLPHCEALDVVEASLQLRIRHKSGTVHAYVISFDVNEEIGLEQQLNEDLSILISLMQEGVHEGELHINSRKYLASETDNVLDPPLCNLFDKFPVMVMPPKLKQVIPEVVKQESIKQEDPELKPKKVRAKRAINNDKVEASTRDDKGVDKRREYDVCTTEDCDEAATEGA